MRINGNTTVDELYHGDNIVYIDLYEDEIVHFKYIKREKLPNGKYRYYYDQSELDAAKALADKTRQTANLKAFEAGHAGATAHEMNIRKEVAREKLAKGSDNKGSAAIEYTRASEEYEKAKQEEYKARVRYERARDDAVRVEKAYKKKKISSFVPRTIAKGTVKVANLLSGVNKKPKKRLTNETRKHTATRKVGTIRR